MKLHFQLGEYTTKFELPTKMLTFCFQRNGNRVTVEIDEMVLAAIGTGLIGFIGWLVH